MKTTILSSLCVGAALMLLAPGCGRKEAQVDATQPLQETFQAAEPEVKQVINTVNQHLQARDYRAATRALEPMVTRQRLTEPQKQAVGTALLQINQAIAADPTLDTKEMYELRRRMFQAVHSGPRF